MASNNNTLLLLGLGAGALFLFKDNISGVLGGAEKVTQGVGDTVQGVGNSLTTATQGIGGGISSIAGSGSAFVSDVQQTLDQGTDVIGTIFGQAQRLVQGIGDNYAGTFNTLKSGITSLIDKATTSKSSSGGSSKSSGSSGPSHTVNPNIFNMNKALIPKIADKVTKTSSGTSQIVANNTLVDERIAGILATTK